MRSDMFELIIERPRGGAGRSRKGRREEPGRVLGELALKREPMSHGRFGSKYLTDNLAPLRRFLEKSIGRPWNTVHSEIRAQIACASTVQKHVLDHLRQMVIEDVVLIDGRPHAAISQGSGHHPLSWSRWRRVYVCPRTGLLRRIPKLRPSSQRTATRPLTYLEQIKTIDGTLSLVTLARVPATVEERRKLRDVVLRIYLDHPWARGPRGVLAETYGREGVYAVAHRRLTPLEIRAYAGR